MKFDEFVAVAPKSVVKSLLARVAERQNDAGMPVDPESALNSSVSDIVFGDDPRLGGARPKSAFVAIVGIGYSRQEWFTYNPKCKGWV